MKMNRQGFSLVEVLIATAVAALLSVIVSGALWQAQRVSATVERRMDLQSEIFILKRQLAHDISGASVPLQYFARVQEQKNKKGAEPSAQSNTASQAPMQKTAKKEIPPLSKLFVIKFEQGMPTISLITNNPLTVFVSESVGTVKPKIMRVRYTFQPSQEQSKPGVTSYKLVREEFPLDQEQGRAYVLADRITSVKISAIVFEAESTESASNGQGKKTAAPKLRQSSSDRWDSDEIAADEKNSNRSLIPDLLIISMTMMEGSVTREFKQAIPIMGKGSYVEQQKTPETMMQELIDQSKQAPKQPGQKARIPKELEQAMKQTPDNGRNISFNSPKRSPAGQQDLSRRR